MSLIPTPSRSDSIDRDTLHFLIQSPTVQFMYWQLSFRKQRLLRSHFQKDWRELTPALRFHEWNNPIASYASADPVSELLLPSGESCFLSGFIPGRNYFATLGIRNAYGQFLPLLRSNSVHIPIQASPDAQQQTDRDPPFIYKPLLLHLSQAAPDAHEHFSAYSVYVPKNTYSVDMESGGDTD